MHAHAIVVAAGRGLRAGGGVPKQYRALAGVPVLARTLAAFLAQPAIASVRAVIHPDDASLYHDCLAHLGNSGEGRLAPPVHGGETRQESVRAGLEALAAIAAPDDLVLVHDGARPFPSADLIARALKAGAEHGAALPGIAVSDTVKLVDGAGLVEATPPRERLRAVQTPQVFAFAALREAHARAAAQRRDGFTDDGALMEWAGARVAIFPGDPDNVKLTHPEDFEAAERHLAPAGGTMITRVGTGFDVHAFGEGDHVWLGGVRIACDRGVIAHSDGDVVLHALTDALLGALAEGDIGTHFPPSDPRWRGASSDRFLAFAAERVRARGGVIDHLDVTVLAEAPRVGPHREAMAARIADIAGLPPGSVSLKATTTEKLGFTGRREGIAAQAAATIRLPAG